nr:MAG TPA: hypothetical protein [Caudoviricetes sp.]
MTTKDTTKIHAHSTMPKRKWERNAAERATRERLASVLDSVPDTDRGVADNLADELVFMAGTLATLKQFIVDNGAVAVDDRTGMAKESPAVRSYNSMVPRYASVAKQLCKMGEAGANAVDPLMEFINGESEDDED